MILKRAPVEKGTHPQSLHKAPVDESPAKSPAGTPQSDVHPLSPPPQVLPDPQKEPPNRAPAKRDAPFPELSVYLSKFPVNGVPRFPNGPLCRETSVSRTTLLYTFLPKSPVNESPSMSPNRVPMEREASSPEPMVYLFIHSFISARVPNTEQSHNKTGEIFGHRPRSPTWTEGLHTMGCGLVPQGDRLRHCNLYPSAMPPSARYLPTWLG